jgi:3-hydroxybutyryl-CoA dehydrogenase
MKVAVIGAGTMGSGIAQVAAQAGHRVVLFDTRSEAVDKALPVCGRRWTSWWRRASSLPISKADGIIGRITPASDLKDLQAADW